MRYERKEVAGMKKSRKILCWSAGIFAGLSAAVYIGGCIFFANHFFAGTEVNDMDISFKTAGAAEKLIKNETESYELEIINKDGTKEQIAGSKIDLKYIDNEEISKLLKRQNVLTWVTAFLKESEYDIPTETEYDEEKLKSAVKQLKCFTEEAIPPENAKPEFNGTEYIIREEKTGSGVDTEKTEQVIKAAIDKLVKEVDLQKEECYLKPEYTSESEAVLKARDLLNQYITASITYSMDVPVVVDKQVISGWLSVDENMEVKLDEEAVKKWLTEFGDKYDTMKTARTFTTPNGKTATVTGGTYGWSIDEESEFTYLMDAVKKGETATKEPTYYAGGTAASHSMPDWGSTYVDVDLSQQHMWYVVNGTVALETDVVTGEPIPEKITPEGVYSILEKSEGEILVGEPNPAIGDPGYETFVNYWMRVTWEGIGFHDATWQSAFGGALNQITGIGSHGCINMPLDKAAELYGMLEMGTPVVVHY